MEGNIKKFIPAFSLVLHTLYPFYPPLYSNSKPIIMKTLTLQEVAQHNTKGNYFSLWRTSLSLSLTIARWQTICGSSFTERYTIWLNSFRSTPVVPESFLNTLVRMPPMHSIQSILRISLIVTWAPRHAWEKLMKRNWRLPKRWKPRNKSSLELLMRTSLTWKRCLTRLISKVSISSGFFFIESLLWES